MLDEFEKLPLEPRNLMKSRALFAAIFFFFLAGCYSSSVLAAKVPVRPKADIVGAGATFPAPLYQRWIKEFSAISPGFTLSYDAVGSGEGSRRFMAEQVDFGASDSALTDEQMVKVGRGAQLIPATAGIIVLAYNLPDVKGQIRLSRELYVDIFLGKIRQWDDPRIVALNPGLKLPRMNIVTVTRNDSSGTTWTFANHLSAISSKWQEAGFTASKKISWPGNSMAANYNEGVATKIRNSWGSIGYVEYGIASRAGLAMASLENKEGNFVAPMDTSGAVTLATAATAMPANLRQFLPDPGGRDSYPIITYSWLLLYKAYADKAKAEKVRQFVKWGLVEGQSFAAQYGFTPLPKPVVTAALQALDTVQ